MLDDIFKLNTSCLFVLFQAFPDNLCDKLGEPAPTQHISVSLLITFAKWNFPLLSSGQVHFPCKGYWVVVFILLKF